jgi:hypothetical protein
MGHNRRWAIGIAAAMLAFGSASNAYAVEGGASFYLLGGKLPLSGVVPGPGMYFQNDVYIYSGSAGANLDLPLGGEVVANVDAFLAFEAPTLLYVTPWEVLGGRLGFGATLPVGYADIEAQVDAGPISRSAQDDVFTVGDPIGSALLGWDAGKLHWSLGASVNVPIGDYQEGEIANISLNRWVADVTGAVTWLDPALGLDLSTAVGITFNGYNEATDYNSGNEFHLEAGITKIFSPAFLAGLGTYYNHQITDDDGPLGPFKGRVFALGGFASYTFEAGNRPVTASLKYYREFDVKNRLQGDAAFVTVAMPLWVPAHAGTVE